MDKQLAQKAIKLALDGKWQEALAANLEIIDKYPEDTDALNRIARAYSETGDLDKARKTAQKILKIDPFNTIAQKSLDRWKGLKNTSIKSSKLSSANMFLEEPGKTKIVSLMHLGSDETLSGLDAGDEVYLKCGGRRASVVDDNSKLVGRLPDDLSNRLANLIKYGNKYEVFIKSIKENDVKVFVRETERASELKDIPSFPAEKISYISFTPPELVHDREEIQTKTYESEDDEE